MLDGWVEGLTAFGATIGICCVGGGLAASVAHCARNASRAIRAASRSQLMRSQPAQPASSAPATPEPSLLPSPSNAHPPALLAPGPPPFLVLVREILAMPFDLTDEDCAGSTPSSGDSQRSSPRDIGAHGAHRSVAEGSIVLAHAVGTSAADARSLAAHEAADHGGDGIGDDGAPAAPVYYSA